MQRSVWSSYLYRKERFRGKCWEFIKRLRIIPVNYKNNEPLEQQTIARTTEDATPIRHDQTALIEAWLAALKGRLPTMQACVMLFDSESNAFEWRQNTDVAKSATSVDTLRSAARLARRSDQVISTHERQQLTVALRLDSPSRSDTSLGSCAIALDSRGADQADVIAVISDACKWLTHFYARRAGTGLARTDEASWASQLLKNEPLANKIQGYVDHIVHSRAIDRAALGLIRGRQIGRVVISGQRHE